MARTEPPAGAELGASGRAWREIAVAPVGPLDPELLERLVAELSRHVELPCRPVDPPVAPPLDPVPGRPQVDADRLLARLEATAGAAGPAVGVTDADLGLPLFTFVFGRARIGGAAALVSLARLRPEFYGLPPDPALVARRAAGEILHELGHLAGRAHCRDAGCLMWFASSVEAADLRGFAFCPACAAELPHGLAPHGRAEAAAGL